MTGLTAAFTILGVVAGLLVAAASVVAFFRANLAKSTIDTLRDSNAALTGRVAELEAENGRQATKLEHLEQEAADLRTYVSGTEAIARLEQQFADHRADMVGRLDGIAAAVGAKGTAA
jgi:cell division protein FtsB